jgi:hypothetical protein
VSVIDDLKGLEDRVAQRMKELRPLVDEYRELEQVAERLGVPPPVAADTAPAPARRARRSSRTARPKRRPAAARAATATGATATATAAGGEAEGEQQGGDKGERRAGCPAPGSHR